MTALAMILAAAEQHAQRIAIEDSDGCGVRYGELIARARGLARVMRAGVVVELSAARTVDFVAGCLGAWLAGAAWMPVDPDEPAWRRPIAPIEWHAELAYVIATSGSSGVPKRVMVGHRGLPALLRAQIAAFELAPGARSLWLHAPRFDASVSDWGTALAAGATLVIPSADALMAPGRLRGELVRRQISHVDLPPSLLAHLPAEDPPPGLRVVVLGGEPCPIEPLRALARRVRVVVVYGPTEATVCSSLVVVDPARWQRPLIGDPLPGVVYRMVDGELWIGGDCLALGYAGDAEATARAFVERDGRRMYRTGDRVEPCDGGLAFVGRLDRQRKIAGVRIELGEVEAVIRRLPGVRAAAVIAALSGGRTRMVAFVEAEAERADAASLRTQLVREAPPHLVPSRVVIGPLPRTPSGKVDYAALASRPLPVAEPSGDSLERELARLWCEAIGAEAVTAERFRAAGGDSLAQLTLQAAAAARGLRLDPDAFAGDPTFAELVAAVRGAQPMAITVETCETRGLIARLKVTATEPVLRSGTASAEHGPIERLPGAGAVLITGATGRLGGALLRAWRAHDSRPIIVLVRAPDVAAARRRLAVDDAEIDVVCGDVAQPYFGHNERAWRSLASRLSAVVHAAARIDLAAGWDAHAATNVGGAAEIGRLIAVAPWIAWHHVSTLSVFVGTDRATGTHREADNPADEAIVHGGYAQTKIAAEAIARGARGRAVPTTILRLGLLTGATGGDGRDQLAMTLRGLAKLVAIPAGAAELRLDITPIDHAAAAVAALALRAERDQLDETHHIASATGASFGELCDALRATGTRLDELAPAAWAELARSRLADPDIAMAYVSLGRAIPGGGPASFDLFLATGADFDVARTNQLLGDRGVVAPRIDPAALTALCRAALAEAP